MQTVRWGEEACQRPRGNRDDAAVKGGRLFLDGAVCLRLLCDTHTPPDLFSNGILLASANASPHAPASALLACQPQGWHRGFQNLITATVPRPPRLPPLRPPSLLLEDKFL